MARRRAVVAIGVLSRRPAKGQTLGDYSEFLQDGFEKGLMICVRGPEHILTGALAPTSEREIGGREHQKLSLMEGVLSKFIYIGLIAEWFNADTLKASTANDFKEVSGLTSTHLIRIG